MRSFIVVCLLLPLLLIHRKVTKPKRGELPWLLVIVIPGAIVTPLYFYGFEHLSVGIGTLLFFTSYTIGSVIYGLCFFKEKLSVLKILSTILGVVGLFFIALPYWHPTDMRALGACMVAGLCGACEITFTKKLSKERYSSLYIVLLIYFATFILTLGMSLVLKGNIGALPLGIVPWSLTVGYSVTIILAIVLVVQGYKVIEPSIGGIIGLMEAVFGVIFGVLLFNEGLTISEIIGMICILVASLMVIEFPLKVGRGLTENDKIRVSIKEGK